MTVPKIYRHDTPFELECGQRLEELTIAYHTYGSLNDRRDNVVWVCHALTADSDVRLWWPGTVEPGRFLDPARYFIVCANILGSCYGTTGPLHTDPSAATPYYRRFPLCTIRDIVNAHRALARHLGISAIHALVGSSVGGFQAVEWAVMEPSRFGRLVLIATDAYASPWTVAIDETQRMAIETDPTYRLDRPDGGRAGLAAARAIGMLTYRGASGYNASQQNAAPYDIASLHRAQTYQRHQGDKLTRRFDAYSYMAILRSFDTHDVGRDRGGLDAALARIACPTLVVGLTTDIIFTPGEMRSLASRIPRAQYCEISSPYGHDGFLVEADSLNTILKPFIDSRDDKD